MGIEFGLQLLFDKRIFVWRVHERVRVGIFWSGNNGLPPSTSNFAQPAPSPSDPGDYSVQDMDLLKSTFFCGMSIGEIDGDCDNAIPCPSGVAVWWS
mmetsp:Transcript_40863/g.73648  ORF Transcript_40863/g.73648 Transcript_40863/m.73648 type:complete len:97 (-) Transcript_40863:1031-1321(-)